MRRRFAVLDRDGTVVVERHYLSSPDQVELIDGAAAALQALRGMGLGLVVVTNQSALGRGLFDQARLDLIHRRLGELLEAEGVGLEGIYVCPHRPEDGCQCRKPLPGLMERAARELDFDVTASFVIGDKACDIEMGRRIGATTFLVRTGYGAAAAASGAVSPQYVVDALADVVPVIRHLIAEQSRPDREGAKARGTLAAGKPGALPF